MCRPSLYGQGLQLPVGNLKAKTRNSRETFGETEFLSLGMPEKNYLTKALFQTEVARLERAAPGGSALCMVEVTEGQWAA